MSVLLLLLGVLTTAAGLILLASGVTVRDGAFDAEFVIAGTIAAVGGLLLIGMGVAVRELRRIERALVGPSNPRTARLAEASAAAALSDSPARIPFPPKTAPQPAPAGENAATPPAEDAIVEGLRAKFPTLARRENGPVVAGADVSSMPQAPARAEEHASEVKDAAAIGRGGNGAAPARVVPRLEAKARPSAVPGQARRSVFNAIWPVGPRPDTRGASAARMAAPPAIAAVPVAETAPDANAAAQESAATASVTILKSGVIEGMAYTLYSDGSIEAQLPQGTLRFGSIAALRTHIESTS
jgi:hypothetical protein